MGLAEEAKADLIFFHPESGLAKCHVMSPFKAVGLF